MFEMVSLFFLRVVCPIDHIAVQVVIPVVPLVDVITASSTRSSILYMVERQLMKIWHRSWWWCFSIKTIKSNVEDLLRCAPLRSGTCQFPCLVLCQLSVIISIAMLGNRICPIKCFCNPDSGIRSLCPIFRLSLPYPLHMATNTSITASPPCLRSCSWTLLTPVFSIRTAFSPSIKKQVDRRCRFLTN